MHKDIRSRTDKVDEDEEAEEEDEATVVTPVPKLDELTSALPNFYPYFRAQQDTPDSVFDALAKVDMELKRSLRKQKKTEKSI